MATKDPKQDENTARAVASFKANVNAALKRRFVFLLAGRTGTGKSSTVNTLMGQEVAPVGDYEPTTMSVESYHSALDGVKYEVVDTPGLCDDLEEAGNDERYLAEMRERAPSVDCLWYVSRLDETRVTGDERRGIRLISKAFGPDIWDHAIIVFTFAGNVSPEKYSISLLKRAELIRHEIASATGKSAEMIPAVAADNTSPTTPDGKPWLSELYTQVLGRLSKGGGMPFFLATASSLRPVGKKPPRIQLDAEQKERVKSISAAIIPEFAIAGAVIGEIFGPAGAAIGAAAGAAVGFAAWLWG